MTHPSVEKRLPNEKPAIALESAVVTAGLPPPQAGEAVRRIRAAAEAAGAAPCFVGVLRGRPTVGLSDEELERLSRADARKVSTRDLAAAVADEADAGTTVAATLCLAHLAGLEVMATGGIGGVHPLPEDTDISADLHELARTPVIVVCSGPKPFLDVEATLEYLETLGVPVLGFGTDECPGFWCAGSGHPLGDRADDARAAVARWRALRRLSRPSGMVVCVPPPPEEVVPSEQSERWVSRALRDLQRADLRGPEVTPFLLHRIAEISDGQSVRANLALLERNAAVAAEIAVQLKEAAG